MKKVLHNLLLLLFLFCSTHELKAQMVYMPDSFLRVKLTNIGFGTCIVGDSIDSSCPLLSGTNSLNISNASITNLQGIEVFTSLTVFLCYKNSIDSLPPLPLSLTRIDCSENPLGVLPSLPASLTNLGCANDQLTVLPTLPPALTFLACFNNQFDSLPNLPNTVFHIDCSNNNLTSLPILPTSLNDIACSGNLLTSLPTLPALLTALTCDSNQLTSLPTLPSGLLNLNCQHNLISTLPSLSPALTNLICGNNPITALPALPSSLTSLYCDSSQLTALPALPASLTYINCYFNQITSLPALPTAMTDIECSNNLLTALPSLPASLVLLDCSRNQITSLPTFPPSLRRIFCSYNLLSTLPDLPDSVIVLYCNNNTNLNCFPKLNYIQNLYWVGCGATCIPNYGNVSTSTPPINSFPLCNVFNTNGCSFFWNISGKAFLDLDNDCLQSVAEPGLINMHLLLYENGVLLQQAFSSAGGFYSFDVNNFGNYEVQIDSTSIPFSTLCPGSNNYLDTISISDSLFYDNDFSMKCKTGYDVGVWSVVSSLLRPAHSATVIVSAGDIAALYGGHCASGISGSAIITINGSAQYSGPSPGALIPSTVAGNVLTYNILNFDSITSGFSFEINVDTLAAINSQICIDIVIAPSGDNDSTNNIFTQCFTVHASYDPNEKEVYPIGNIDTSQHYLTYTIHFQNTGTASAENIYILDTLDNTIDIASFQLLSSSHPSYVQILDGGIARFNFSNINLPDSNANEPMSHGYVQYKVKLKNNLSIGTQIHNTANIYFDFNPAIVTNTTTNTIDLNNTITNIGNNLAIKTWPVPFRNEFTIQSEPSFKDAHFSVLNMLGSEMFQGVMSDTQVKVSTGNWTSGIYFLRIKSKTGLKATKLIKY